MMLGLAVLLATSASSASIRERWAGWKIKHEKKYEDAEDRLRFDIFRKNMRQAADLTARHAHRPNGARFGPNIFADRTEEELRRLRGFRGVDAAVMMANASRAVVNWAPQAATVDWRVGNWVSPIQDQGQCGSCWAFSATANIESRIALKTKQAPPVKLSEQFLVDCDHHCGTYRTMQACDSGCEGGLMPNAFLHVKSRGQPTETSYPYTGADGTCQSAKSVASVSSWEFVPQNETAMAAYVERFGPVSIAVDASEWSWYLGGIMEYLCWGTTTLNDLDHGVAIVGYGTEGDQAYWIIRNSWSTSWGESGYCRILRNVGFCGVQLFACSSLP